MKAITLRNLPVDLDKATRALPEDELKQRHAGARILVAEDEPVNQEVTRSLLEEAGLVARRKDGRTHHLRLVASPLKSAANWLYQYQGFWEAQLDSLERFLDESDDE